MIGLVLLFSGRSKTESLDQFIDKQVHRMMKKHHLPAFAITVVEDQNILYKKAKGFIDLENERKASSSSVFKLYSVAKVFTAMEIFREMEEGLIQLDDPLSRYLPDFRIQSEFGTNDQINIRSILAHQSGLPRNECLKVPVSEDQTGSLNRFEIGTWDCIQATPAGSRYKYSNLGYDLLGRVIEENRKSAFSHYMRSRFLNSLGMYNATFDSGDIADKGSIAKGYSYFKGDYHPMVQHDIESVPSGNFYASLEDLSTFLKSFFGDKLFQDPSTLPSMFNSIYKKETNPETMGLGWKTKKMGGSELLVWHDGGPHDGIGSLIAILPDQKLGIAMSANCVNFSGLLSVQLASKILNRISDAGQETLYTSESESKSYTADLQVLKSYEGKYIAWGSVMQVSAKKDKLKGKIGGFNLDIIPLSNNEFRVSHWVDRLGLTKLFKPPMDFKKLRVSFPSTGMQEAANMIINMDYYNYEICPRYPETITLPEGMQTIVGTYDMVWRLPYNKPGPSSGTRFTISFEDEILWMSGVFGPIVPVDACHLKILSGPFAGEIIEYDPTSGQLLHQNGILIPNQS